MGMDGKEIHTLEPKAGSGGGKEVEGGEGEGSVSKFQVSGRQKAAGSQRPGSCRASAGSPLRRGTRGWRPAQVVPPFISTPPLFGKPGGGVCLLPARTAVLANQWEASRCVTHPEGQSAFTVLLRRQSLRGGSGAVALSGEGGRSRQRPRLCSRRCLAHGARPDPFSLGRLEGARTVGASNSRASTRQATDSRLPPSAGAREAAAPEDVPQALPDRLAWPPGLVHPSGGKVRGEGAGLLAEALWTRRGACLGWFPSVNPGPPSPPRVASVYSHGFFQAWPSNPLVCGREVEA